jgi:DNA-binding PadR family transcriptional regulator
MTLEKEILKELAPKIYKVKGFKDEYGDDGILTMREAIGELKKDGFLEAIQLTQSKIISIIDKRIEELEWLKNNQFRTSKVKDDEWFTRLEKLGIKNNDDWNFNERIRELESLKLSLSEKEVVGDKNHSKRSISDTNSENNGRKKEVD